jgi:hypothetical protein
MAATTVLRDRTNMQCEDNSNCTTLTASAALSFAGAKGALAVPLSVEGICELLSSTRLWSPKVSPLHFPLG